MLLDRANGGFSIAAFGHHPHGARSLHRAAHEAPGEGFVVTVETSTGADEYRLMVQAFPETALNGRPLRYDARELARGRAVPVPPVVASA